MWYEIKVKVTEETSELIASILVDMYASGIVEENPRDIIFQDSYDGDWDYFEVSMDAFEYDGILIKAYLEFGEKNEVRIDNSCMSSEIQTLNGELDCTKIVSEYLNIENWMLEFKAKISALSEYGFDISKIEVEYSMLEEIDYVKKWQDNYHAFDITENIVVCPSWEKGQDFGSKKVIYLDPGAAFGTGTHETTSMCAEAIVKYSSTESSRKLMYDIGCGSGILSIVGKISGFENVIGIDIDERSVEISRENAVLNSMEESSGLQFKVGNLLELVDEKADIIVANIIADIIIMISPDIKQRLVKGGIFICSGIIDEKCSLVIDKLEEVGFQILEKNKKGEWNAIVCRLD